ncbi:MAG: tripartite tricarboxylate transporter permease [Thermovirgaceae bacterium]
MEILQTIDVFFEGPLLLYLVVSYFIGFFFGAVPGLTATLAISLLLPLTFGMEPLYALVSCVGIFIGGIYGGGVTGILINIPGAPAGALTAYEGYKLTEKGLACKALGHGAFGSMIGGVIGAVLAIVLLGPIAEASLHFKTPDKFSLILMAIVVVMFLNTESLVKGAVAVILGLMLGTVGIDHFQAMPRATFGIGAFRQGVDLLTVVVGTFAVSEILTQFESKKDTAVDIDPSRCMPKSWKDMVPDFSEIREIGIWTYLRSTVIGFFTGVLPGAGASMAALLSYGLAKSLSRRKEDYGHGSIEGIAAAEVANNAMCPGAIIPMLIFGIPGDAVTAIILGVFIIHGLIPGPMLLMERMDLLGPMLLSMTVTPILIVLSLLLVGRRYIYIISVRKDILYPFIAVMAMIGLYAATFSVFQLLFTIGVGVGTYALKKQGYPAVPFLLGFILGPLLEKYLRSTLAITQGDPTIFLTSPFSLAFLVLSVVFAYLLGVKLPRGMKKIAGS